MRRHVPSVDRAGATPVPLRLLRRRGGVWAVLVPLYGVGTLPSCQNTAAAGLSFQKWIAFLDEGFGSTAIGPSGICGVGTGHRRPLPDRCLRQRLGADAS